MLLPGGRLDSVTVCWADGQIASVGQDSVGDAIDGSGYYLSPGFVDIHLNGGGGASFESESPDDFRTILETGLRYGTTSVVAAINTATAADRIRQLEALDAYANGDGAGRLLGVHLEGPYYSPDQRGAHHPDWIRHPDPAEYDVWLERFSQTIKVVTLAPELPGSLALIERLSEAGIVPSIGHSMATDTQVDAAIEAGAKMVTHIYNAQSSYTRSDDGKHLGVAEMGLLRDALTVEMIPDNRHLTPRMQALVVKTKPSHLICVTTDAMEATGQGPGEYEVMGGKVWVDDEVAYREDRKRHAGSILTMDRGVRNVVSAGASVAEALMMATEVPARAIGVSGQKGTIEVGGDVDFVLLDPDLQVAATVSRGDVVYAAEGSPFEKSQVQ